MSLQKLIFTPGLVRDRTAYSSQGYWRDGDKIRFRDGFPETIGGWSPHTSSTMVGPVRHLKAWTILDGSSYIGAGSFAKYYVIEGDAPYDVTPIRVTTAAGDVTFSATDGSNVLTVTDTSHGADVGDYVTFSGAVSLGGNVTAGVLNTEYVVATVTGANAYTVVMSVTANASDTGNGGAAVVGEYQLKIGQDSGIAGAGWGAGPWSSGGWGEGAAVSAGQLTLSRWSADNFGEDLVMNRRNGAVYYWDASAGLSTRAVNITSLGGAQSPPQVAAYVLTSDQDRHLIAFGCDPEATPGTQDPLTIRWCDQENAAEWRTLTTNTAGEIQVSSGSAIVSALQTKREILVFTESSLHSMQFIGPPYTFGLSEIANNITLASPAAIVSANDVVYWMGAGKFFIYDGQTNELACPIKEYIFNNMNRGEIERVSAGHNEEFSEVWWFYQSTSGTDCDSYVVFNYQDNIWYFGTMERTAWLEQGTVPDPLAASADGYLYAHEVGINDGSTNPASAISAYIESADVEIGDGDRVAPGDRFFFARRVIPDITFRASTGTPSATFTVKAKSYPGSGITANDDGSTMRSASGTVEQFTKKMDIRLRGRSFAIRVESNEVNTEWRLGVPRIDVRLDGGKE